MRDLTRFCRTMSRCTRALFLADILLTAVLGGLVVASLFWPGGGDGVTGAGDLKTSISEAGAHFSKADIDQAITGKALFRTSAMNIKEKVVNELAQFELKGVSTRKGQKIAYLRDTKLKKLLTKKVGDTLGAYEILDIGAGEITLKRGAETLVLSKG